MMTIREPAQLVPPPVVPPPSWSSVRMQGCWSGFLETELRRVIWLLAAAIGLLVPGCKPDEDEPKDPVEVKGSVVDARQKKAVPHVLVTFWPQDKTGRMAEVMADKEGKYVLSCPPGRYKITIVARENLPGGGAIESGGTPSPGAGRSRIPDRYKNAVDWELAVDVPDGGLANHIITLKE